MMPSLYRISHQLWAATPDSVKSMIRSSSLVNKFKKTISQQLLRFRTHQEIYDAAYFEEVDRDAQRSMEPIADSIVRCFHPQRALDVGCGTGVLLANLQAHGVTVFGLEYSDPAIAYCQQRHLQVEKFDLESDLQPVSLTVDIVISMEVAEHLPERVADQYVDLLTVSGPVVIFTAAPPGQGGNDHVNEQPKAYWIDKFASRGFHFDAVLTATWQAEWSATAMSPWYYNNLLIFRKTDSS